MSQAKDPLPKKAKNIDEVIDQLDEIIDDSVSSQSFVFAFAFVYRETTAEIKKAIENGEFEDNERMESMDVVFANLFIETYYKHKSADSISKSWGMAFRSAKEKLSLAQHILLGMNAHINLDLAIAALRTSPGVKIIELKNDFMLVNDILAGLTNRMQKSVGKVSIMMKLLDVFGFKSDEKIINFSIKKAREISWLNAMELALTSKNKINEKIAELDKNTLRVSALIRNPPGITLDLLLKFIRLFEVKEPAKIIEKMRSQFR